MTCYQFHSVKAERKKFAPILLISLIMIPVFFTLVPTSYAPVPWWNNNWNFRKNMTLNHTMVKTDLTDFPIVIDITDPDLKTKAQTDGDDIVFTDTANNTLKHEIEFFDSITGHIVAWIKIPQLSSTTDTELYMYYGNPSAANQQNRTAVWDSNYLTVQHMAEISTIRYDSTKYGNNATTSGTITKTIKIDGADLFTSNKYARIPQGFLPISAITVELWMKPTFYSTSIWAKYINTGPTTTRGISGGQSSKTADRWYMGLTWDSGAKSFSTGDITTGLVWNHVVITWNGTYATAYLNGAKIKEGTASGTPDWTNKPVYLGSNYYGAEGFNGAIDEVRISNIVRQENWIGTTYNIEKNPTLFCATGTEESNTSGILIFESPQNEATNTYTNPTLSARVINPSGINMTIIFKQKILNLWTTLKIYENSPDGTYTAIPTQMGKLGVTYYWAVCVTDGFGWTNKTYSFTTTTKTLEQKWMYTGAPYGVSGALSADINGDGIDDIIQAGKGGVIVINGTNGKKLWNLTDYAIGDHAQGEIADLNKDGKPEIVIPLETPAGILALYNNGTTYWRTVGLGKETYSGIIIFDIDGTGYPNIFIGSTDTSNGINGTGRVTRLSYDGRILNQAFAWRPCSGGLSIADTNYDGEFELYMGERNMYLSNPEYGDNDYGKGVVSFWARNLTLRWYRPEVFCSSQKPMIADVNKDGILDVIIGDLGGGLTVLNATDGSTIKMSLGIPNDAPTHYQPSVYDIDQDGNLEMLMADFHNTTSDDLVIWDLVSWKVDARLYIGKCFYGPQLADVNGDGAMEIIACNFRSIFIIDKNYRMIDGIVGLSGDVTSGGEVRNIDGIAGLSGTLNYAVAQDIDGDNYTELVVTTQSGSIYAFDTPARRPNPRPRTEVQFYSEFRQGVAEYVQPQGGQAPTIYSPNPANQANEIPTTLTQLEFSLTDYQKDPINYTIATSPNIGFVNRINQNNGRHTLQVGNLTPSTTYTWIITATDGTHTTNQTYTFNTGSIAPWWNTNWPYRKKITIDHAKIPANMTNFPTLIDITDTDLASKAQINGADITFTDENNRKLTYERELYMNTNGHLVAWVNIPHLSSIFDTTIFMYYGNQTAADQQNHTAVWDSNYLMIQHLEEPSGTRYDSTIHKNNATIYNTVTKALQGKIDGADQFSSSGYERIAAGFLSTSAVTIELWLKPTSYSTTTWTKYINTGPTTTTGITGGQSSKTTDSWYLSMTWDAGTKSIGTGSFASGYVWNHITIAWNGSFAIVYRNGIKIRESPISGTPDWANRPLTLGSNYGGTELFSGALDEIRVSNIARSSAWIQASYNNQKDTTTFYIIKTEETIPKGIIIHASSPPDKSTNVSPSVTELSFNLTNYQGNLMNYAVMTNPNIGSGNGESVGNGRYSILVSGIQYFKTYTWTISATNGTQWTNRTYSFTTLPSEPPTQDDPTLSIDSNGNLVCLNQTTRDPEGAAVTNIYHWYRNNTSLTNLVMPFETNNSITAKDYSDYNNNGIIVRGAKWTKNGKVGGAYTFDRGLIQIPGSNTLDGGGKWPEITVEHWIYLTASQSGTRTIARIPSFEIGISGNRLFASIWVSTGSGMISGLNKISSNTTLSLNMWYHVALTYKSGTGITLYINGIQDTTKASVSGNIQPGGFNPMYIGWFDYFKGMIDEVRIYPRSLSQQQINQHYLETRNGLSSSSTIVSQETKTGETWKCEVTPNDGQQDGTAKASNIVIIGQNNKPIAKNLIVIPALPKTNDDLTATYTYFDPDGNPESGTQIRWYKNNMLQSNLNDTLVVSNTLTTKGETWYFTVKPQDGTDFGELQTSPSVTIQNTQPMAANLAISPTLPYTQNTLTATYTFYDADEDPETETEVTWYKNGIPQTEYNNTMEVPETATAKNEVWHFTVKPNDGTDFGTMQTSPTVTIQNSLPSIYNVRIEPDPANETSTLTANPINWTDADGDPEGYTYQWQKYTGGQWVDIEGATSSTLDSSYFGPGDSIRVWVTPYDGQDYGEPKNDPITISDS